MSQLAIIGGTGLTKLSDFTVSRKEAIDTPYGAPSAELLWGKLGNTDCVFLPRHGEQHQFPPHKVNYRANIWALKSIGIQDVIGVAAVGGLTEKMGPKVICVADQLIDYTYGREHTFHQEPGEGVEHIDFTYPYNANLRQRLINTANAIGLSVETTGCYGATQGPRLETAAEVQRLIRDGNDLVGMTGMPEAALAKEAGMHYANISLVVNWGAGLTEAEITMDEIHANLEGGMQHVVNILGNLQS